MICLRNEPRQETKREWTRGDGRNSGTMSERGREANNTARTQPASPPIFSTHGVDISRCSPVRKMQSNEGLQGLSMRSSLKGESVAERAEMHQKLMKQLADFCGGRISMTYTC